MDNKMFKDVLKEARMASGLKQSEVAEQMSVTSQTYLKWENGRSEPKITQAGKLSTILNVSVNELCKGEIFKNEADPLIFMRKIAVLKNALDEVTFTSVLAEFINDQTGFIDKLESELRTNDEAIRKAEQEIQLREQMSQEYEENQKEMEEIARELQQKQTDMEWMIEEKEE
ncbi:helix-turn-helix transcriptional regulator [Vibrio penaeicida]|uniref:helix-turn-helix transcriptional regulator n=1 Tax=Vibrio penaeicida TaxID=104609 RepID=UPI001CC4E6E4|nr:helix-turn-helix domain-containing protein [Vibrio penaeicida]